MEYFSLAVCLIHESGWAGTLSGCLTHGSGVDGAVAGCLTHDSGEATAPPVSVDSTESNSLQEISTKGRSRQSIPVFNKHYHNDM